MDFHNSLESLISSIPNPLAQGKEKSMNISKIISKLESGLAREMRNYSKEKQALLQKAVSLEKRFLRKEFGKMEYYELKAAVHKKMILLDLQTSICENSFSVIENASKLTTLKENEKLVKERELLSSAEKHIDDFWEAKKLFSSNKMNVGQMQEKLRAINSEMVDIEHALSVLCNDANKKEQARAIIQETVEKLGKETAGQAGAEKEKNSKEIRVPHHISKHHHIQKSTKKKRRAI